MIYFQNKIVIIFSQHTSTDRNKKPMGNYTFGLVSSSLQRWKEIRLLRIYYHMFVLLKQKVRYIYIYMHHRENYLIRKSL